MIEKKCEDFMTQMVESGYTKEESLSYLELLYCSTVFGEDDVNEFKDFINYCAKKEKEIKEE